MRRLLVPFLALTLLGAACGAKVSGNANHAATNTATPTANGTSANADQVLSTGTATNGTPPVTNAPVLRTALIRINPTGLDPRSIQVAAGTVVAFLNQDSVPHRIVSDPHPSHSALRDLDSAPSIAPGATYTYTFTRTGTWGFHDDTQLGQSSFTGHVVVATP